MIESRIKRLPVRHLEQGKIHSGWVQYQLDLSRSIGLSFVPLLLSVPLGDRNRIIAQAVIARTSGFKESLDYRIRMIFGSMRPNFINTMQRTVRANP